MIEQGLAKASGAHADARATSIDCDDDQKAVEKHGDGSDKPNDGIALFPAWIVSMDPLNINSIETNNGICREAMNLNQVPMSQGIWQN